jgi:hypothetical protein
LICHYGADEEKDNTLNSASRYSRLATEGGRYFQARHEAHDHEKHPDNKHDQLRE